MGVKGAVRTGLARLAAGAPARVFLLVGSGGRAAAEALALDPRLLALDSPRSANVLLAVGGAVAGLLRTAAAVHDQASRPRVTVWWPVGEDPGRCRRLTRRLDRLVVVAADEDPAEVALRCQRELLAGARATDPEVLPDREPAPWRGVGPYGQGGEGMMGGTPYGRPMAMRAPDRDGLELDRLPLLLGPFFPHLPPGLALEVKLQGDVFQEVAVGRDPFTRRRRSGAIDDRRDPFVAALRRPVPVAELELARARHHLRHLARTLRFHGLAALGERTLRLALALDPSAAAEGRRSLQSVERWLRRTGTLRAATRGVGRLGPEAVGGLGPVARASGLDEDLRSGLAAYGEVGFEPVAAPGDGDAWSRLVRRLREADQALELVGRCARAAGGGPEVGPLDAVEAPRGRLAPGETPPAARLLALVSGLLAGLEWGDALAALVSLDLDLEEAALPPRAAEAPASGSASGLDEDPGDDDEDDGDSEEAAA